jgi:integrase
MLKGTWSRNGKGLAASTVNVRVQQVCDFLTWMVDKRLRDNFDVPYTVMQVTMGAATRAKGRLTRQIRVRGGKARGKKRVLRMPMDIEVRDWLSKIKESAGPTLGLLCETVLLTGMRREEVVSLRTDTLPGNRRDWHVSNPLAPESQQMVRISIKYGTKGASYGEDHGDKVGPERSVLIPLSLANRWHAYRMGARNLAFKRWMKGVQGSAARVKRAEEAVHLFLREGDGARFSGKQLYDAWVSVERPVPGWSPHQGRHWWACSILWRELKKLVNIGQFSGETAAALLDATALSIIRLQIQPQLGHADDSTTMLYLGWVVDMISLPVSLNTDLGLDHNENLSLREVQ